MTLSTVKGKLHEYIDSADEKKIQAIYTLVENEIEDRSSLYDEATLDSFRKTSEDYASGKIQGFTVDESMNRIRKQLGSK